MPNPPAYNQTTDFSNDEGNNVSGRSTVRTSNLDTEFINIEATLDQIVTNLALAQSSDGTPKDDWVDLPSLATDVTNWITTNGNGWYAIDTGAVNAMVVTLNPPATTLTNGMFVVSDIILTNTSATVTINVNGLGAKAVVTNGAGATPSIGALTIGTFYGFQYDSSADKFQIVFSGDSITHSSSASASATAANTAKLAAEAALDAFTDQYLGAFAFASLPTVDGDGDALTDGDLAYDTTNNVLMIYDLATTTWLRATPTASDQTHINTVSGISSAVSTVSGISSAVSGVNSISSAVSGVNSISSAVSGVNSISSAVSGVNTISAAVSAVNSNSTNINTTATNIANVNIVGAGIANVDNFANRYRVAASAPSTSLTQGDLYFNTSTNEMSSYGTGWQAVAISAANQANINICAGDIVFTEDLGNIVDAVATSTGSDISVVAGAIANINLLAPASVIADMALLGDSVVITDMALLALPSVIDDMALLAIPAVIDDMALLALPSVITDLDLIGATGVIGNIATVASNVANVNRYAQEYIISSSAPTSPTPAIGDLWMDTTANVLKYHNGSAFVAISAGIANVLADTSPALGGNLDCNDRNLTECGTISGDNLQIDFGGLI